MANSPEPNRIHRLPVKITYNIFPSPTNFIAQPANPFSCFIHPTSSSKDGKRARSRSHERERETFELERRDRRSNASRGHHSITSDSGLSVADVMAGERIDGVGAVASVYLKDVVMGIISASPELDPFMTASSGWDHTIYVHAAPGISSSSSSPSAYRPQTSSGKVHPSHRPAPLSGQTHPSFSGTPSSDYVQPVPGLMYGAESSEGYYASSPHTAASYAPQITHNQGYTHPYSQYPFDDYAKSGVPSSPFLFPHPHPIEGKPSPIPSCFPLSIYASPSAAKSRPIISSRGSLSRVLAEPGTGKTIIKGRLVRSEEFGRGCASGSRLGNGSGVADDKRQEGRIRRRGPRKSDLSGMGGLAALLAAEGDLGSSDEEDDALSVTRPSGRSRRRDHRDCSIDGDEADGGNVWGAWGVEIVISLSRFDVHALEKLEAGRVQSPTRIGEQENTAISTTAGRIEGLGSESVPTGGPSSRLTIPNVRPAIPTASIGPASTARTQPIARGLHRRTGSLLGHHPTSEVMDGPSPPPSRDGIPSFPASSAAIPGASASGRRGSSQPVRLASSMGGLEVKRRNKAGHKCSNCGVTESVTWRQRAGQKVCNACGMYWNAKRKMRPPELWGLKPTTAVRKRKQPDLDASTDIASSPGPAPTAYSEPLGVSAMQNVPAPAQHGLQSTVFAGSRFHTQSLQSRKRARFEDQVQISSISSTVGIGGRGLTSRGLVNSGFKRTLSTFAEGESLARADKRRATRGEFGLRSSRMGVGEGIPGLISATDRQYRIVSHPDDAVNEHLIAPRFRPKGLSTAATIGPHLHSGSQSAQTPDYATELVTPSAASPSMHQHVHRPALTTHDSFDLDALINWEANGTGSGSADLEALFRLSQDSATMLSGSQDAVFHTDQAEPPAKHISVEAGASHGGANEAFSRTVSGVDEIWPQDDATGMAYLDAFLRNESGSDHNDRWMSELDLLNPSQDAYTGEEVSLTPRFDFSPLPPSSPPLLAMDGMDDSSHSMMLMSSPGGPVA